MTYAIIAAALAGAFGFFALIARGTRRHEAERAEEYRKEASLRGWRLEIDGRKVRYSGTTEGIPWTFDTVRHRKQGEVRYASRWETAAVRSDEVVLVWAKHAQSNIRPETPDFVKQLAFKAVEHVFGVEARLLAAAKDDPAMLEVLDDTPITGAVVTRDGMRLVVPVAMPAPSEVAKVVALGVKMARTRRR